METLYAVVAVLALVVAAYYRGRYKSRVLASLPIPAPVVVPAPPPAPAPVAKSVTPSVTCRFVSARGRLLGTVRLPVTQRRPTLQWTQPDGRRGNYVCARQDADGAFVYRRVTADRTH